MTYQRSLAGILASLALAKMSILPVSAELPSLNDPPWLGYFAVHASKRYEFGVTSQGTIQLNLLNPNGSALNKELQIPIAIAIQETSPDGKVTTKQIKPESLQSAEKATEKLEKVAIKGQITGDIPFEIFVEQARGAILIGGRMTNSADAKNPTRFNLQVKIPNPYPKAAKIEKKDQKAYEKIIAGDRVSLKHIDGKRQKLKVDEKIDTTTAEFNGTGISSVEADFSIYKGKKIEFATSPNATMKITNAASGLFREGFSITWTPDPAKDLDGKARLMIVIK